MTLPVVFAIGGIFALLVGLFGGGVKAKEVEVPPISLWPRLFSILVGMVLIGIAIWLGYPSAPVPLPTPQPTAIVSTSTSAPTSTASSAVPTLLPPTAVQLGKIAVLSHENEAQDLPDFKAKLASLGFDIANNLIYSADNQDASVQQQQAELALTDGAKVLVVNPIDPAAAAAIADAAHAKNVQVISYDSLITGSTSVNYYVAFDDVQLGKLQATALMTALGGVAHPTIVMINGNSADRHAVDFKRGAHSVFDPLVTAGKLTIAKEYDTLNWDPAQAQAEMTQALAALNNKVDGVYVANDGMAGGALAAMKGAGFTTFPPMTGQDATVDGIQRILTSEQYMTVYKNAQLESDTLAKLAYDLAADTAIPSTMLTGTTNNGLINIPSILVTPVAVTKNNIETTVIADGFWQVSDICTPVFAAACAAAGVK